MVVNKRIVRRAGDANNDSRDRVRVRGDPAESVKQNEMLSLSPISYRWPLDDFLTN